MKYLQFCTTLLIVGFSFVEIKSLPIENRDHQVVVLLPENVQADLPASTLHPEKSVAATLPLTLLNVEDSNKTSGDVAGEYQRRTRMLGLGGLGGLGGKFSGLGLGGFGGLGHWGLGGLHGFGLGGFKPLFGHFFG